MGKYKNYFNRFKKIVKTKSLIAGILFLLNILYLRFGYKTSETFTKPVMAMVEVTSRCNLKCAMCIRDRLKLPLGDITFENFKKVLSELLPSTVLRVHIQGQGEPFIVKDVFKMIDYAKENGYYVTTVSNGTLINKEIAKKICLSGLSELAISIDAPTKEICESIRSGVNFDRLVDNLKTLKELRDRYNKSLKISFWVTLMKQTVEQLPQFIELANKLGIDGIYYKRTATKHDYIQGYDENILENMLSREECISLFRKYEKKAKELGIILSFAEAKCNWPWSGIAVNWEGYISPCCLTPNYREPYFGNIFKESFDKIWNSKIYKDLRSKLSKKQTPACCKGCRLRTEIF